MKNFEQSINLQLVLVIVIRYNKYFVKNIELI